MTQMRLETKLSSLIVTLRATKGLWGGAEGTRANFEILQALKCVLEASEAFFMHIVHTFCLVV